MVLCWFHTSNVLVSLCNLKCNVPPPPSLSLYTHTNTKRQLKRDSKDDSFKTNGCNNTYAPADREGFRLTPSEMFMTLSWVRRWVLHSNHQLGVEHLCKVVPINSWKQVTLICTPTAFKTKGWPRGRATHNFLLLLLLRFYCSLTAAQLFFVVSEYKSKIAAACIRST